MEQRVVRSATKLALQIAGKINQCTDGKYTLIDTLIKTFGWSTIAFAITQITRRIWHTLYRKYKKYPPGPIGLPIFGCFFNLLDYQKFYSKLGPSYTIAMYPVGPNGYEAVINDMKLVNKLSKLQEFSNRSPHMARQDSQLPTGFTVMHGGKEWSHRRKLFYNSILKITDSKYMTKYVQSNIKDKIIIPSIEQAIKQNDGRWDPSESCFHYAFSTIFGASFGPNIIMSADDKNYTAFQECTQHRFARLRYAFVLPIFSLAAFRTFQKYMRPYALKQIQIMSQWIENKEHGTEDDKSYIDMMLEANLKKEVALADISMTFRVGTHTTAGSVQLMLYQLAKHPEIQNKVYLELKALFKDAKDMNIVDPKSLNNAHYLRALIEESFRMRSVIGLTRVLAEDFRVDFVDKNGKEDYYVLPKGCAVLFNHVHMFRTEDNGWKNGNKWNIRNYLDENDKFVRTKKDFDDRFKMSIFGFGRRMCPGISLARREIMFAVAILVYKYEFCGPKGKGDVDFDIPKKLPFGTPKKKTFLTVIKRK